MAEQLKFYDMKTKKPFVTDNYKLVMRGHRKFAEAIAPSGVKAMRTVGKDFK